MKIISIVLAMLVAFPSLCRAQALADKVPADALIYLGWRGVDDLGPDYDESHLKAVMKSSQFSMLLSDSLPKLIDKITAQDKEAGDIFKDIVSAGSPFWHHPSAFYFGGVDLSNQSGPLPKLAILCDAGADSAALVQNLNQLVAKADPAFRQRLLVKTFDHLVVISSFPFSIAQAQSAAFPAELAKLNKDPVLAIYIDGAGMLSAADQIIGQFAPPDFQAQWPKVREASGLAGLKRIFATSGFEGKNWVEQVYVDAPAPRTGLLAMIDSPPLSADIFKLIPQDSTIAGAGSLDLGALFTAVHDGVARFNPEFGTQVDQGLAQVNQMLGFDIDKDFLSAFGSEWAYYLDPTSSGAGPFGFTVANRVRNGPALEQSLTKLETMGNAMISQALRESPMTLEMRDVVIGGVHVHYLASPMISPAWAIKDGVWYFGLYPQTVAGATSQAAGGKTILDNPAFIDVRKRLGGPEKISSVAFLDVPRLAPLGYQYLLLMSRWYLGLGDLFGLQSPPMVLPTLDKLTPELNPAGSISWSDATGFHAKAVCPFPGSGVLATANNMSMGMAMEGPILIGIMLPSLNKARESANRVKCAANERQIRQAILLYANDTKGKYPPDLGTLLKNEDLSGETFLCPDSNTSLPENWATLSVDAQAAWVNAHSDYIYVGAGLTMGSDPINLVLYEKASDHHNGMNMLYVDGHVEFQNTTMAQREIAKGRVGVEP